MEESSRGPKEPLSGEMTLNEECEGAKFVTEPHPQSGGGRGASLAAEEPSQGDPGATRSDCARASSPARTPVKPAEAKVIRAHRWNLEQGNHTITCQILPAYMRRGPRRGWRLMISGVVRQFGGPPACDGSLADAPGPRAAAAPAQQSRRGGHASARRKTREPAVNSGEQRVGPTALSETQVQKRDAP